MKFAMLIIKPEEEERHDLSDVEREFGSIAAWWAELKGTGRVVASARLAPPATARSLSWRDGKPLVTDGPFVEAKESVGGVVIVDVQSEAEAMQIARCWLASPDCRIEVRAVVDPP